MTSKIEVLSSGNVRFKPETCAEISMIKSPDSKVRKIREKRRHRLGSDGKTSEKGIMGYRKDGTPFLTTKEEQSIQTLKWLEENFIRCPGVCLPRCIMYAHYLNFCQEYKFRPACAATFGKIIRQKFPELTTRRLGTRGNSKYHYYGVAIKESSSYYHTVYSGRGLTRFSGSKLLSENDASRRIMSSAKSGTLLPDFPSPSQLVLPNNVEMCKMDTLMIMYRTHCQCILDTAVSKNYEGIHQYLVHFWQGIPKHLKSLFEVPEIVSLVCICDSIMYMVLNDILVPVTLEEITDQSLSEIRNFVQSLEVWLQDGLKNGNTMLIENKLQVARRFVQAVKRQVSFLHLAQSFREVLSDKTIASNLLNELDSMDIKSIGAQAIYTTVDCCQDQNDLHEEYLRELKELLRGEASVETYIEWLEGIYQTQVLKFCETDYVSFKLRAQEFLLSWSFFGTRVMHMLTLNNSRTYGPFHLIRMMLDEYLLLITETRFYKQEQTELQKLSEKLIKGTTEQGLRISNIVTKSKFGAPTKPPTKHKITQKVQQKSVNSPLPPFSSLQATQNFLKMNILPNDSFSKRYGEVNDPAFTTLLTLTPPSSPIEQNHGDSSHYRGDANKKEVSRNDGGNVKSVSSNVENLVDEHFRNCGIDQYTNSPTSNEQNEFSVFLQKFLCSQDQTMNPYEVSDDVYLHNNSSDDEEMTSPLQCSFSQILKGDVLFSDEVNGNNTATNSGDNSKNLSLSFNNYARNMAFMDSLSEPTMEDDMFPLPHVSTLNVKELEMTF